MFDKVLRGAISRLKGFIYLTKYFYIFKKQLAFNSEYLKSPYDIKQQLFSRIKSQLRYNLKDYFLKSF